MGKCKNCGRHGLFLKLKNGLCSNCETLLSLEEKERDLQNKITELDNNLNNKQKIYSDIVKQAKDDAFKEIERDLVTKHKTLSELNSQISDQNTHLSNLKSESEKELRTISSLTTRLDKLRTLIKSAQYSIEKFNTPGEQIDLNTLHSNSYDIDKILEPTVTLNLNCMNVTQLRKQYRQIEKMIQDTFERYKERYTTKANSTIYQLMVIALKAELQNILFNIKYGTIDSAIDNVKAITKKYYEISTHGNQSIANTVKNFIGEIEYQFIEAVKTEYEYFVQKERIKEEQRAIREQMRQEAEERKLLEQQRKQIEKEEEKYKKEISNLSEQLSNEKDDSEKALILQSRINELNTQLAEVETKKETIVNLQNGKAGHVYIISNLGSFGENTFKIGMTRRIDPQERINELGNASVPFPFDIHSTIFSEDAVGLENKLHKILNNCRVNKINMRKEFFNITLDELEELVLELEPSAEFNKTMVAEQYRQSQNVTNIDDMPQITLEDDEE